MNIIKITKIILVVLSTYIIFYYTNLAKPIKSNIDDGNYLNNNSFLGNLINHKPGYVCPLGVILGKLLLFISFIQVYYIYNNKYSSIRFMNLVLLILGYIVSFMNKKLQSNIFTAFILQLFVIILPDKKLKN
tara:strand:+ start:1109 stop:1504 length:396 start_codon:yes stop_codon:yes gene_type:complete